MQGRGDGFLKTGWPDNQRRVALKLFDLINCIFMCLYITECSEFIYNNKPST